MAEAAARTKRDGSRFLDRLSSLAQRRLRDLEAAGMSMSAAYEAMRALPRGEVVRAMLEAAGRETWASRDLILEEEQRRAWRAATSWAREALDDPNTVVLDSETTGIHGDVDFLEIAVIDRAGETLFDRRVRPVCYIDSEDGRNILRRPIPCTDGARRVHGIQDEDLKAAPSFAMVYGELVEVLRGKRVIVYNAEYDAGVWAQAVGRYRLDPDGVEPSAWGCAMRAHAGFVGEYRYDRDGDGRPEGPPESFRWHALGGSHGALGDCRATLRRICEMAGREVPEAAIPAPRTYDVSEDDFESIPF